MEFEHVYTARKEHTKEQFLREALIRIASNTKTPVDAVKADFGEVKESVKEVIVMAAHVSSDYSASIGYDREEDYRTTESKYLNEGEWYTYNGVQRRANTSRRYEVDVVKTRTVTDWQPFSGHIDNDVACAAINGDEEYDDSRLIEVLQSAENKGYTTEEGEAVVSQKGFETVKSSCINVVESEIDFPGDRYRDFHSNPTVDVNSLECYKLPFYEVEYTYKGKKYKISDFANGDFRLNADYPPNDVDVVAVASNDTKPYRTQMIVGWATFGLLFVLSCVLMAAKAFWLFIPTTLALALAITLHVISDKKYSERIRELTENNVISKRKELENVLTKKGYDKLTEDESGLFDSKKIGETASYSNQRKGVKIPAIICSIATAILIIVSIAVPSVQASAAKDKALHSPDQITVSIISKTQEFKETDSVYSSGCYYIYLDYKITAKDMGATYVTLQTTIYDKSGKELGELNTSLDIDVKAGSTNTYSTYVENYDLDRNETFKALYNTKFSDLKFEIKIKRITFSDGKYWKQGY